MYAEQALRVLLRDYKFKTVLDVGCGSGQHAEAFLRAGKSVTVCDIDLSKLKDDTRNRCAAAREELAHCVGPYEAIWASHVLEHQLRPNWFLTTLREKLIDGGVLAVTVPPLKHNIVGGHVSLWNAGLLLYHLALARFDCSKARVKRYGYNISVIVTKREIVVPPLVHDRGDIAALQDFLPVAVKGDTFNGDIAELNW